MPTYTISVETTVFRVFLKDAKIPYSRRVLASGSFNLTGNDAIFKASRKIPADTGIFNVIQRYAKLNYSGQTITLRDEFAADAPVVQDYFIPTVYLPKPAVVLNIDDSLGINSDYQYRLTVMNYYIQDTAIWSDDAYHAHFGSDIPELVKSAVAQQVMLYDKYIIDAAAYLAEYNFERLTQWPYFWADQVLTRRS